MRPPGRIRSAARLVVVMGTFWFYVLGIVIVFSVVILLVVGAERAQTDRRTQQNDHR